MGQCSTAWKKKTGHIVLECMYDVHPPIHGDTSIVLHLSNSWIRSEPKKEYRSPSLSVYKQRCGQTSALWQTHITMENHNFFNGKTHYFHGHVQLLR